MNIYLYSNKSIKNNMLVKDLTFIKSVSINALESEDVLNPVVILNEALAAYPGPCNYAYIDKFRRFYYVNCEATHGHTTRLTMHVDPLGFDISNCYVNAIRSSSDYDLDIDDSANDISYPDEALIKTTHQISPAFSYTSGCCVLSCFGKGSSDFINRYVFDSGELSVFNQYLWNIDPDDLVEMQAYYSTPLDSIISLKWLPLPSATVSSGNRSNIFLADIDTQMNASTVTANALIFDAGYIDIDKVYNDYRDYKIKLMVNIPFIGVVPLDTYLYMGKSLHVIYKIDCRNCKCDVDLIVAKKENNTYTDNGVTDVLHGDIGYDIPVSAFMTPSIIETNALVEKLDLKTFQTAAASILGGGMSGNVAGLALGAVSSLGSMLVNNPEREALLNVKSHFLHASNMGQGSQIVCEKDIILYRYIPHIVPMQHKADIIGYPCPNKNSYVISHYTGFLQGSVFPQEIYNQVLTEATMLTDTEKDYICSAVGNGVYVDYSGGSMYTKYVVPNIPT